jgi:hypothetical protein
VCSECGDAIADEVTNRPGTQLVLKYRNSYASRWYAGKTQPDHLPLIAVCRDCLGLKPKALERAS